MKNLLPFALAAAFCAAPAFGQATSDPVGYYTTDIGAGFSATSASTTLIAPNLEQATSFSGVIESISDDQVVLTGAAFTDSEFFQPAIPGVFSHFIEASVGGYWSQITANDTNSVTLTAGDAANLSVGETVTIKAHATVISYFGAGEDLNSSLSGNSAEADNIVIIDEINGGTVTIFRSPGILGGTETYVTTLFAAADDYPIYPNQGIQFQRLGDATSFITSGAVDINGREIQVNPGINVRPIAFPIDVTLDTINLQNDNALTSVRTSPDGDSSNADLVTVLTAGIGTDFFFSDIDLGSGPGWYSTAFVASGDTLIPAGSSVVINRGGSAAFTWSIPSATSVAQALASQ